MNKQEIDLELQKKFPKEITEIIFNYYTNICDTCSHIQTYCEDCKTYNCVCYEDKTCKECPMRYCECKCIMFYKICPCCESYLCNDCYHGD